MTNFLKQTLASLIGSLLGLTIFSGVGTLGFLLILIAVASSQSSAPTVKDKSVLVFDLSMKITDTEPNSSQLLEKTFSGVEENNITLRKVVETLDKAGRDQNIVGIYIDGTNANSAVGYASLKEIRQALEKFRKTGKKIIAYSTDWREKEYYLSSVANQVIVNPMGAMEMNGLSSQPMFLAGAFEKYGVGVQIVRVGKFKGAVEPLILDKLSPENREQTQKLLDDVWGEWRTSVGASRKILPQKLQAIANSQPILEATEAKSNSLVDTIAYEDQVFTDLKKLTGNSEKDQTFTKISLGDYAEVPGKSSNSDHKIAIVYAEGEIVNGSGDEGQIGGDNFAKIFSKIRQNDQIKAVVFRINSPGGSATAAEIMQREIKLTRQIKPVIVSMGDVAASGGYWIASDSNRIFAQANTITGSIGVFGVLFNGQKLGNNNGITWDSVKTAQYADQQTISRPKSPQELAVYQRSVDRIYNLFLQKVSQGRKIPTAKVAEIAQGRVWSGTAAKQIGLVDEIGGLNVAIEYAAKQAKLGTDWEIQEYPRGTTFVEKLFGKKLDQTKAKLGIEKTPTKNPNPLINELEKFQQEIKTLQTMNDPQGIYTRLPINFKIE
ncbi:signal peptide peptidase SppA [Dolichospermum sp. LEGE 00240]|jgi:protease IV|uniref:signal peptide peptidase SppA n=1 Tax=Dolichospermum sp. LEGE 00240 TaxID=1828603 RepID=UPI0018816C70|nr:signal peptide peptidase SppA [Dolichospermum sp. LEGE 00240]MDM3843910.1 signal peptide peptidase SppA [Aphanizomenon gracile PMC638.10]MDM3849327.1 signal peptide peptidase SppA [Aphanizomenon gracile PMC627.10]MDM3858137.1 signal peptide peptidase SppA [Aphanizomenon gracile PMC649.10]MDM3861525.1 signal peptide peptidase SppA [Aphanizomenon gracile PMC644.10]MBE9249913.1 signal peptide peptidase SppA [Dolichospermum sp. LEGE 00240]